ncbi:MAG TPA: hypothetical protein VGP07_04030 [Polyangia bacterium]|jgi:hypothetical protein
MREWFRPSQPTTVSLPRAQRLELALFATLILASVAPLFAGRYLPFFDYPAHLSVPAALRFRAAPATHVAELWDLKLRLVPNSLHYGFVYVCSFVMSIELASRLFVALFCVAALPLAAVFLLRTFGRDWRLAVLIVPLAWNRCLWYGFIDFCAALPLALVALALVERELERPSAKLTLAIALTFLVLPFAHFFVMGLTGLLAVTLLLLRARERPPSRLLRAALPLLAGPLVMASWFLHSLRGGPRPSSATPGPLAHLWASRPRAADYGALLHHWFMDGYTGAIDDVLALVMIATLALLTIDARRATPPVGLSPRARVAPLVLAAVLVALYLLLPFEIRTPFDWWAMNVRVLPLLFVALVVALPPGTLAARGRLALIPVTIATAAFLGYVAVDVHRTFNGPWGMAGFAEVIAHAPAGARVLGLYTDYRQRPHYAHYPFYYASSYSVVEHGGMAAPRSAIPQSWTDLRRIPEFPPGGDAALFRFPRHAPGFSHFLVRTCEDDAGCVPDPLRGSPDVRLLSESGKWRLYACASPGCADGEATPPPRSSSARP